MKAAAYLNRAEEILVGLFLGIMTILTFTQVVLRYVFDSGLVWSLEATTYSFGWMVLLGASMAVREGKHICVTFIIEQCPPVLRRALALLAAGLCLLYAVLMTAGSVEFVSSLYKIGHYARDLPLPRWLLTTILPLGFALLGWRFIELTHQIYKGTRLSAADGIIEAAGEDQTPAREERR